MRLQFYSVRNRILAFGLLLMASYFTQNRRVSTRYQYLLSHLLTYFTPPINFLISGEITIRPMPATKA